MKYTQHVLVEFNNSSPAIYKFQSNNAITIEVVAEYFIEKEGFNEEKDAITFVDEPETISI